MTSIGVIGSGGVLGSAIMRGFMEHAEMRGYDLRKEKSTHRIDEAATADIIMIALPTPALPDGRCDTSAIDKFLDRAHAEKWWTPQSCYVIRSTVPIGYTQRQAEEVGFELPLLHSPEFLTARCSLVDFQIPARNIVGSPLVLTYAKKEVLERHMGWNAAERRLGELYANRFPGVQTHFMHSNASELVKLACNSFFAAKVTMFNLFYDVAQAAGVPWDDVRAGILSDGRIAHAHTSVNQDGHGRGYGGSCLPKDLADIWHCAEDMGVNAEILRAVFYRNVATRKETPHVLRRGPAE